MQNGDYVYQTDTATLYEVIDQSMLSDATGYVAMAAVTAAQISDATVAGRALLTAANLAAQLTALGGGTAPTGTGPLVLAISPTFTGTTLAANIQASGTIDKARAVIADQTLTEDETYAKLTEIIAEVEKPVKQRLLESAQAELAAAQAKVAALSETPAESEP